MAFFQCLMCLYIIFVSLKLVKDVINRSLDLWFIVQSYLSTILMFAGLYSLMHRLDHACFAGLDEDDFSVGRPLIFFIDFFTFSVGCMSAGLAKVTAAKWYSELLVSAQMLCSIVYWCVILGSGLDHVMSLTPAKKPGKSGSQPPPIPGTSLSINSDNPHASDGLGHTRTRRPSRPRDTDGSAILLQTTTDT